MKNFLLPPNLPCNAPDLHTKNQHVAPCCFSRISSERVNLHCLSARVRNDFHSFSKTGHIVRTLPAAVSIRCCRLAYSLYDRRHVHIEAQVSVKIQEMQARQCYSSVSTCTSTSGGGSLPSGTGGGHSLHCGFSLVLFTRLTQRYMGRPPIEKSASTFRDDVVAFEIPMEV